MEQQPEKLSLNVLPHSGKVEQLRSDPGKSAAPSSSSSGGANASHVNRMESSGLDALKQHPVEEKVVQVLRTIYDPEIPVNLYDLGLIYDIEVDAENRVKVRMTLTAPGCPVAGSLPPEVEAKIENIPEVKSASVELVWEPTWGREMMSEVARLELGM
jgi:FeS assembly SUF system protein